MGKKEKEHKKRSQNRTQRLKDTLNHNKKQYKAWMEETKKVQAQITKEYQMAQLIQKNIDDVRNKAPEIFIVNEDGTYKYNTELVSVNDKDEVVFITSSIPVFETYSDKKITAQQYLEIIKDLTENENTEKEEIPEIVIDEPMVTMPANDVILIEGVTKDDLPE
jgi:hypothetical protein